MKRFFTGIVALATMLALGFTSCKSGDDDDYEPLSPEVKELVSPKMPSAGWSGDSRNGVYKYSPSYASDTDSYFAFRMKDGVCVDAVLNVVFETSAQARQIAGMLNNGTWVDFEDDDDDDEEDWKTVAGRPACDFTSAIIRKVKAVSASRSGIVLPIPVRQDGRVVFIMLPNLEGLSADELSTVMDLWSGKTGAGPERVIFGTYENGVYTCRNMHGMNIDYVIETDFNAAGFCTRYSTSITLPTEGWAELYFDMYEEQIQQFEEMFGRRPDLRINGKTIVLDAVIIGDVPRYEVDAMIYTMDWMNNCPLLYHIF
ncbi:MAG: hypothetical protein K2F86_02300 [Duncaniella sp.]|nr:hypothetical protein [Duncaniella sp.]